jgi:hypothetical protein
MNIFVLDTDPRLAAQYHCDQHVIKMILESAQMLCTALRTHGAEPPYQTTHPKHPCTLWAQQTRSNWLWLKELAFHLNEEYQARYQKSMPHKSWLIIEELEPDVIPEGPLTPFVQAMPNEYKHASPVTAYRQFYCGDKSSFATWKYSETPFWYVPYSGKKESK